MKEVVGNGVCGKGFLRLGVGGSDISDIKREVVAGNVAGISAVAGMILDRIEISPTRKEVLLWEVSGKELGQKRLARQAEVFALAFQSGFSETSAEAIARSRVVYAGQGWKTGGMSPIQIGNNLCLLDLRWTCRRHWLGAVVMDNDYLFSPNNIWLFERSLQ
ncbi:MAG: hypothetical protein WAV73_00605 [Candidatus Moraniibacteriota bacterium]